MVKLNLKDVYQMVPVHRTHHRYLRFVWKGGVFEFTSLQFGLASAPCTFTKLLKPVATHLRQFGIRIMIYLDDILLMAPTPEAASKDLQVVMHVLTHLGFVINERKSITSPSQVIEFLGFRISSVDMALSLPQEKVCKIRKECRSFSA